MGKLLRILLGAATALLFAAVFFAGGLATGASVPALQAAVQSVLPQPQDPDSPAPAAASVSPEDLGQLFAPFWESWKIIHEEFVDQPVDDDRLMRGAIRGMLEALGDEHTTYMDPNEYEQASIELEGQYEGIGAWVDPDGEFLVIVAPMPDSPAEQAGLLSGDVVIAVDGEDMTGLDGSLVIRRIMGPAGSTVRLTILREGRPDPLEVSLKRASITVPSVEGRVLDEGVGYVQVFTFGDDTTEDLRRTLPRYLAAALTLAGDTALAAGLSVDRLEPGRLATGDLDAYDVLILAGVRSYTEIEAERIAAFVKAGRGLMLFPGPSTARPNHNTTLLRALGIPPLIDRAGIAGPVGDPDTLRSYESSGRVDFAHPLLSGLFDVTARRRGDRVPTFESPRIWKALGIGTGASGSVILQMGGPASNR